MAINKPSKITRALHPLISSVDQSHRLRLGASDLPSASDSRTTELVAFPQKQRAPIIPAFPPLNLPSTSCVVGSLPWVCGMGPHELEYQRPSYRVFECGILWGCFGRLGVLAGWFCCSLFFGRWGATTGASSSSSRLNGTMVHL